MKYLILYFDQVHGAWEVYSWGTSKKKMEVEFRKAQKDYEEVQLVSVVVIKQTALGN